MNQPHRRAPGPRRPWLTAGLLLAGFLLVVAPRVLHSSPTAAPAGGAGPPALEAILAFSVSDAATGLPIPCKITLLGAGGRPGPALTGGDIAREEQGAVAAYNRIMSLTGEGRVHVPVGRYDVYVSRGPEWDLAVERGLRVGPGGARLRAALHHVVDSAGWLSADFHVHSAASYDSRVPMEHRVYEFASDGVEMLVSTDHNVLSDYAPIIETLGAKQIITSATGEEVTTRDWGHFGSFPLTRRLGEAGNGAIPVGDRKPEHLFRALRGMTPVPLVEVNHPRLDPRIGYFELAGFDSASGKATRRGFSLDFDALEVLNGYQDNQKKKVDVVIRDWFALMRRGHVFTATGNSDTHHLYHNVGGYPRNYVRLDDDRPASVTPMEVVHSVKAHRVFFTTGPFVQVRAGEGQIGDLVRVRDGALTVEITVQAAPWIAVDRVTLYQDGEKRAAWSVPASDATIRFRRTEALKVKADGYIVVRVDGDRSLSPIVGDPGRFEVLPFALTNPIFFDADGNGRFDPPRDAGV